MRKKMDPESFNGRLVLNGIDKLVFTLLLFLIFAVWTDQQRKFERANVYAEKINSIEIERPIALVEDLSEPVRRCLLFIRLNKIEGITGAEERAEFQSLLLEIEVDAKMIENYTKNSKTKTSRAAKSLVDLVRDFGADVMTDPDVYLSRYIWFESELETQFDSLFESTVREAVTAISGPIEGSDSEQL